MAQVTVQSSFPPRDASFTHLYILKPVTMGQPQRDASWTNLALGRGTVDRSFGLTRRDYSLTHLAVQNVIAQGNVVGNGGVGGEIPHA